jgi:hypothetical protein
MLGAAVSVQRILVAINFPQGKCIRPFLAAADLEANNSGFFNGSIAQLAKDRFRLVGIFQRERKHDRDDDRNYSAAWLLRVVEYNVIGLPCKPNKRQYACGATRSAANP